MLDVAMQAMKASLDGLAARQRIIAENIANAETPGYLAGVVSFEENLRDAIEDGTPSKTGIGTSHSMAATGLNGNNVSVDQENIALIDTDLRFQLAVQSLNNKFRILHESMRRDS